MNPHRVQAVIWMVALAIYILAGTPLAPFHGDESTLIFMSRDYAYQFIQRDLSKLTFSANPASPTEQELRLLNGTVNKYLYGLAWHLAGFTLGDLNEQWDWEADWNYNQQYGHAPGEALLATARWPSALLTAGGMVALFALGWTLGGRPVALFASLYYALSPAILVNGRRAVMESAPMFFSLMTVLAAIWFLRRVSWGRALVMGAMGGLALASKHTAVFTLASVFAACAVYPLLQRVVGTQRAVSLKNVVQYYAALALAGLVTALVFYALNPAWWGANPLDVAAQVLDLRARVLDRQISGVGGYVDLADRLAGFARQTLVALPQYYEVSNWAGYIADPIARYESSVWRGVSVGGSAPGAMVLSGLMFAGVLALARGHMDGAARWVGGVWAALILASVLFLTPLEWQRYYLPAFPAVGLLGAMGLVWLWRGVTGRIALKNKAEQGSLHL